MKMIKTTFAVGLITVFLGGCATHADKVNSVAMAGQYLVSSSTKAMQSATIINENNKIQAANGVVLNNIADAYEMIDDNLKFNNLLNKSVQKNAIERGLVK